MALQEVQCRDRWSECDQSRRRSWPYNVVDRRNLWSETTRIGIRIQNQVNNESVIECLHDPANVQYYICWKLFRFCGGRIFGFPMHKKEKSPSTHGLNYRSACDILSWLRTWRNCWNWLKQRLSVGCCKDADVMGACSWTERSSRPLASLSFATNATTSQTFNWHQTAACKVGLINMAHVFNWADW